MADKKGEKDRTEDITDSASLSSNASKQVSEVDENDVVSNLKNSSSPRKE